MQKFVFLILFALYLPVRAQQIWTSHNAQVSFYSSTPLEDIEGVSKVGNSALNLSTGEILFRVKNTSFIFKKKLMQEHFNENYMESNKFPVSEFKGKIEGVEKLKMNGSYTLPISGTLNVHGVPKSYHTTAKIEVKKGTITAVSTLKVKTEDHHIEIPTLVVTKIAEELDVKIFATYQPIK